MKNENIITITNHENGLQRHFKLSIHESVQDNL